MTFALAFLPESNFEEGWKFIVENSISEVSSYLEYYESTWMGKLSLGQRKPKFKYSMWSFSKQISDKISITNNDVEGWHNKLNGVLYRSSKTLATLLEALWNDQALNDVDLDKYTTGISSKPKSSHTFTNRISNVVCDFITEKLTVEQFLENASCFM